MPNELIDKIRSHHNNNPIEIIKVILDNGFDVSKGLVYLLDNNTVLKRIPLTCNPIEAVERVNSVVPGFIKDYKVNDTNTHIDLYLKKYEGIHPRPNSVKDKKQALRILNACVDFFKKSSPYAMYDFSSGNILLDGNNIHIIDLDSIFNNDEYKTSVKDCYRSMNWLHNHIEFTEFKKIWTS